MEDLIHVADMDETYGTSVDDEFVDNHDYDDDTDDDIDDYINIYIYILQYS